MSIDHNAVVLAIRSRLALLDDLDESQIVWENRATDPPGADQTYVEETFLPFGEPPIGSGYDRLSAEMIYSVLMPRGAGTDEGRALANRIKELYKNGSSIVGSTVTVVVEESEILSGRARSSTRYEIPVAVTIRVEGERNTGV